MWVQVLSFILGLLVVTGVVIYARYSSKSISKIDVRPNAPIVYNPCRTQFTDGYAYGFLKAQIPCKNGCTRVEIYPLDVEEGENKKRPVPQAVIVKSELVKRQPMGEPSTRREIINLISKNIMDYPVSMRGTPETDWMTKEGQKAWLQSAFGDFTQNGDDAFKEFIANSSRFGLTKMQISEMYKFFSNLKKQAGMEIQEQSQEKK